MPSSSQHELHQQRRGGLWRGTGGNTRWDEREEWCSHLHLSPRRCFFPHFVEPSGLTCYLFSAHLCARMCPVILFILYSPSKNPLHTEQLLDLVNVPRNKSWCGTKKQSYTEWGNLKPHLLHVRKQNFKLIVANIATYICRMSYVLYLAQVGFANKPLQETRSRSESIYFDVGSEGQINDTSKHWTTFCKARYRPNILTLTYKFEL